MAVKQISEKLQQIVKKLDEIIAMSRSLELSFSTEVMFKLISAMAIAILVEHLLINDKNNWIVPLDPYLLILYLFGLLLFNAYVIGKPRNIALRLIQSIAVGIYGIYTLAVINYPWDLAQSQYLNILYLISLFCLAVAEFFYLANYAYPTSNYVERDWYENHKALVDNNLSEFSAEEINSAICEAEVIEEKLNRAISADNNITGVFLVAVFWGSFLLFLPIDSVKSALWFDLTAFCYLCFLICLSIAAIVAIVKDIKHHRDRDRFTQYRLIIESYDYVVTKTYTSRMTKKIAWFESEFF